MKRVLWSVFGIAVLAGALAFYFLYAPAPQKPPLSGTLTSGSIVAGGRVRSYLVYVPRGLTKGAPLVVVLHGSDGSGAQMRRATAYGFERLADAHGFAVVYPNGFEGYWNACNVVGDYSANRLDIDDVGFLSALADKLVAGLGVDPHRVFATGLSRGGHMALRLALEAPQRFRAVAAVAANVPAPGNFKCRPKGPGTSSVLIMNGTADPLNPFGGGEVTLFGFIKRGTVLSSRGSAEYFAGLNGIAGAPVRTQVPGADEMLWHGRAEVELVAVQGGGHVIPQPYARYPRILGPTPTEPDGPVLIWDFFARRH